MTQSWVIDNSIPNSYHIHHLIQDTVQSANNNLVAQTKWWNVHLWVATNSASSITGNRA